MPVKLDTASLNITSPKGEHLSPIVHLTIGFMKFLK